MQKADKERLVAELSDRLKNTQTLIVADYRGLSVTDIDKLRGELLEHGARFQVVKNTLTRRAAEEAGADALLALLEGPTAIAFLETDGDPVAVLAPRAQRGPVPDRAPREVRREHRGDIDDAVVGAPEAAPPRERDARPCLDVAEA